MAMMKGASINTAVEGTHGILETEYIEALSHLIHFCFGCAVVNNCRNRE
jgi:hypothetical protein